MLRTDPILAATQKQDILIGEALAAWLASLGVAKPNQSFQEATLNCVSLCQLLAMFAPQHLSENDCLQPPKLPTSNASRHLRYNTRLVSRRLAEWSQVRSRPPSPVSSDGNLPISNADTASQPEVELSAAAKQRILEATDAGVSPNFDQPSVILSLAECLLCAAVHSQSREDFIRSVLTLSPQHQEALAQSIRRTTGDEQKEEEESVLTPIVVNDQNVQDENTAPEIRNQKAIRPIISTRESPPGIHSTPRGIPPAEYKALAVERDTLRRKLAASELEKNKSRETCDSLRRSLDEAGDRIREMQTAEKNVESDMASKSKALLEARNALRDAHVSGEEIDMLRAKAAATDQLEASLKRASKRLEDVADMRRVNKDLETQVAAFRENEDRIAKQTEYLESQLRSSNERVQQLATLSDSLSTDLEDKEKRVAVLELANTDLSEKLETTNKQLASMLVQSGYTSNQIGTASTSSSPEFISPKTATGAVSSDPRNDGTFADESKVTPEKAVEQFDPEIASENIFKETGIKMSWKDVVDCVRGVMDAMEEIDEMERAQLEENDVKHESQTSSRSDVQRAGVKRHRESMESLESAPVSHSPASEVASKESILPAFRDLDSKMEAARGDVGDEFDFAANQVNVEEIPLSEALSNTEEDELVEMGSSRLATVPENREGFEDDEESSYNSSCSSQQMEEVADETINATVEPATAASLGEDSVVQGVIRGTSLIQTQGSTGNQQMSPDRESYACTNESINGSERGSHSLSTDLKVTPSLTISMRGSISRSPSHCDTTRSLVRQARSELGALQNAMELMRAERESSASITVLVQQLNEAREELRMAQLTMARKEEESSDLRRELNVLIKEYDAVTSQNETIHSQEADLLDEKERLVVHLKESLEEKDEELRIARSDLSKAQNQLEVIQESEASFRGKLRESEVIARAQDVEVARLTTRLEASELLAAKLNAAVSRTEVLNTQISKQREVHLNDIAAAARREKELAEEARDEAKRVAESHASVLNDMKATAAAAVMTRSQPLEERGVAVKKGGARFAEFWRKLLHRDKLNMECTLPVAASS